MTRKGATRFGIVIAVALVSYLVPSIGAILALVYIARTIVTRAIP